MVCDYCKQAFTPKYKWNKNRYCSRRCLWDSNIERQRRIALTNNPMKRADVVAKWKSTREFLSGADHPMWRGGVEINSYGYRVVYAPDHPKAHKGKVLEHRLVVEKSLGRFLNSDEIVHHINGDKLDNRLENLVITNRSEHIRIHR